MQCQQVFVVIMVVAVCLLQQSHGHYYRKRYDSNQRNAGKVYSASRYRGYHSGYRPDGFTGLRTIFRNIYTYSKNKADDNMNMVDDQTKPVVIRLPSSIINSNFKMSDLPFYLSSGLFDPNNLPGPLGGEVQRGPGQSLPKPVVDPVNPTGVFDTDDSDNLNNDLNQIFGGSNNILGGANTNLLDGANTNLLGRANTSLLGGANTNLLGKANTNLLGGAKNNLLAGANTNLLDGSNTNILGGASTDFLSGAITSLLGGSSTNILGGVNRDLLSGANTNVLAGANGNVLGGGGSDPLGQGGNTGVLGTGDSSTDFFNTKTGGSSSAFGKTLTG